MKTYDKNCLFSCVDQILIGIDKVEFGIIIEVIQVR